MTQPNTIPSTIITSTKPLLLLNDEQRRRRQKALHHKKASTPNSPAKVTQKSRKKSYIKNHEVIDPIGGGDASYKYKSKSQQYAANKLLHPNSKTRMHSKSGPPRYKKKRKKRTFKLAEPSDSMHSVSKSASAACTYTAHSKKHVHKKASRVFIKAEHKIAAISTPNLPGLAGEYSPSPSPTPSMDHEMDLITTAPVLSPSISAPMPSYNTNSSPSSPSSASSSSPYRHRSTNSFKLGDDSAFMPFKATSFSSYKTKYNVHKPRIKPGSNQLLLSQKMRELQAKLKNEEKDSQEDEEQKEFGKSLDDLDSIQLPAYTGQIPLVLIELKKRLHSVDGLQHKKIFHISFKNHRSIPHRTAHLIRTFFIKLPCRLLDNIAIPVQLETIQIPDVISTIPDPNKSILLWLWDLLADTCECQHQNGMNYHTLSQSMAPYMCTNSSYNQIIIAFFKCGIQWRLYLRK